MILQPMPSEELELRKAWVAALPAWQTTELWDLTRRFEMAIRRGHFNAAALRVADLQAYVARHGRKQRNVRAEAASARARRTWRAEARRQGGPPPRFSASPDRPRFGEDWRRPVALGLERIEAVDIWPDPDDDDGWTVPDDPTAAPAPTPLVQIAPNSSPPNRYGGAGRRGRGNRDRVAVDATFGDLADLHGKTIGHQDPLIEAVRTGAPSGRPRRGTADPRVAERRLLEHCPGRTIEELRGCLRRGRLTASEQVVRGEVADAVLAVAPAATREALATALGCTPKTVDRLREAGAKRVEAGVPTQMSQKYERV